LTAQRAASSGAAMACPVAIAWSSDNVKVATVSSTGVLMAVGGGYATVMASCGGLIATVETKVEAPNPFNWDVAVHDADWGGPVWGVTMEFLDGPRKGEQVRFDYETLVTMPVWPVKARLTAEDYQPRDVVFSETTAEIGHFYAVFWTSMAFAPQPETDTYTGSLTRSVATASHRFTMRAPGNVRIRTWWGCDDDVGGPGFDLWCGGQRLWRGAAPYKGGEVVQALASPASCEVQMWQWPQDTKTQYRIAITYPH
jgi:hypothetical protein